MKKYFIFVGTLVTLLGGCSSELLVPENQNTVEEISDISYTYSLMYDEKTQQEVKKLLLDNKIPMINIDEFFNSVNHFNSMMGNMQGAHSEFKTINLSDRLFDYEYLMNTWEEQAKYLDQNCRLTVFTILKDYISINTDVKLPDSDNVLIFDLLGIEENPNLNFTDNEVIQFNNLFMNITTENTTNQIVHVKAIQEEWAKRGISFNFSNQISLITVFIHESESDYLFVGHAGVLVEIEDGYLFIEKLAPNEPYIASKYSTINDFTQYLHYSYDNYRDPEGAKPIFMKNNQWLDE